MSEDSMVAGHVFISYRREDSARADWLQSALESAGVRVWRDKADLWPGDDWHLVVRRAIAEGALVFLACFSAKSIVREKSWQNDELTLAVDQMRLRPPDKPWLIPVRFDDCEIPDIDLGGGRTLGSIQRGDLFGTDADAQLARLIGAVHRILGRVPAVAPVGKPVPLRPGWLRVAVPALASLAITLAAIVTARAIGDTAEPGQHPPSVPTASRSRSGSHHGLTMVSDCPHGRRAARPQTGIVANVMVTAINAQEICVSWLNPDDRQVGGFIISEYPESAAGDQEGSGAPYPTPALSSQLIDVAAFVPSLRPRPGEKWEMCVTPIGRGVGKNGLYRSFDARQGCSASFTWPSK
jgi:hypothetical protein